MKVVTKKRERVKYLKNDFENEPFSKFIKNQGIPLPKGSVKAISDESNTDAEMTIKFLITDNGDAILNLPKGIIDGFEKQKRHIIELLSQFRASIKRDYPKEHHLNLFPPGSPPRKIDFVLNRNIPRSSFRRSIEVYWFVKRGEMGLAMPYGAISALLVKDITDFIQQIVKLKVNESCGNAITAEKR